MQYPLISEYVDAIRSTEDNLDKLRDLRPVLDGSGNPVMSSGNFAVVFKMKDVNTGRLYAVKCFTREQEGREEAYRQIADELEFVQSTYLAKVRYYDHELFVDTNSSDDSEFPVLLMDWVEGETLDTYIRRNINDTYALEMLAYNFSRLAMWLLPQPFAHGDLKPDNILVHDDGSLTLVDYDGMYVPTMQGQKARELGSLDFRHPLRTDADFNEHIDDFPAISILLSLRLIAADPSLLDHYGASDRLLFAESDYRDLSSCALLKNVFPSHDVDINTLVSLFTIADMHKSLSHVFFRLLTVRKPQKPKKVEIEEEELSTNVTDEDRANAVIDEFGAKYSKDGKRLLNVPYKKIIKYKIKDGTKVICDYAFSGCVFLQQITIPSSVISIGNYAFLRCRSLQQITIPSSVTSIGNRAFSCCESLQQLALPFGITNIGNNTFSHCKSLRKITIPSSVTNIGNDAFNWCESLKEITIPNSVTSIGSGIFSVCSSLNKIVIPQSLNCISDYAFCSCHSLCEVEIPISVKIIGDGAFCGCDLLKEVKIPSGVMSIGKGAFAECKSLRKVVIPSNIMRIGNGIFSGCTSLNQNFIAEIKRNFSLSEEHLFKVFLPEVDL